ncbi:MAG: ABC transporter substrate-binding protein [Lachnospiraceae bacterium]|jgi:ABC-type transport system substrate-binding protein|nr:ABC transporter substrate-binding protein [Lachnospiraceae bacterium]
MRKTKQSVGVKLVAAALASAMVLGACGSGAAGTKAGATQAAETSAPAGAADAGADAADQGAAKRDDLIVALYADPSTLCAGFAASTVVSFCSRQFYDTLIKKEEDGSYSPSLATSWEYINDGKDLSFEIRDDVYFHDGTKMTVDDVVFSYNAIIEGGYADCATSAMDHMEKVDDTHCILYFENQYGPGVECVASDYMTIFPQAYYEKDPDFFKRNPIGTGAYKFVEWKTGDYIKMTANDDYFKGAPSIKDVTMKVFTDTSIATLALENGEVDVHIDPPTTDAKRLRENDNIQFSAVPGATCTWVIFNFNEGSAFVDENLRLAVAHAIDKEAVMIGAIDGEGEIINQIYPNYFFGVDQDYQAPSYDPDLAKELIAKTEYAGGATLSVDTSSNRKYFMPTEIIAAQLAEIGIQCTVNKLDSNAWFDDVFKGPTYDWNVVAFTPSINDFDDLYALYRGGEGQNFGKVDFPELNEAYDKNHNSTDSAVREEGCNEICRFMGDHAICVPLYAQNNMLAANKDLKNVEAHPTKDYDVRSWSW